MESKFDIIKYVESLPIPSQEDKISQNIYKGYALSAPQSFWNAPRGYIEEFTNGCGTEGFCDVFVPDHFYGLDIVAACKIHDWTFIVWNDKEGFDLSNKLFLNNLQRIVKQHHHMHHPDPNFWHKFLLKRRLKLCKVYYKAVDTFGEQPYYDSHIDLYEEYKNM